MLLKMVPKEYLLKMMIWLVLERTAILNVSIGNSIIPSDELILFRGVAQPPNSDLPKMCGFPMTRLDDVSARW